MKVILVEHRDRSAVLVGHYAIPIEHKRLGWRIFQRHHGVLGILAINGVCKPILPYQMIVSGLIIPDLTDSVGKRLDQDSSHLMEQIDHRIMVAYDCARAEYSAPFSSLIISVAK
jgi:hypothetical protein